MKTALCIAYVIGIVVVLIGKGLDRGAVAVRDAILRAKEKRGRGR